MDPCIEIGQGKKRYYLFDNIKFVLMVFVISAHILEPFVDKSYLCKCLFLFIYSFHMPLFLFLSGLFFKNERIKNKVQFCLILYVLEKAITTYIRMAFGQAYSFSLFIAKDISWFMLVLAAFNLLSSWLSNIKVEYRILFFTILSCVAGYDSNLNDYFAIMRVIVYYPFFLLGEGIGIQNILKIRKNKIISAISIIGLIAWVVICFVKTNQAYFLRPLFTGRNPYEEKMLTIGPELRLLCYGITCAISLGVICIIPNKSIPIMSESGSRSINGYFWSKPIEYILIKDRWYTRTIIMNVSGGVLIIFIISIIENLILSTDLVSFIINWIKRICFYERTEVE